MSTINEPADPIAQGVWPTAKQSWSDLFKWKQRVVVYNESGETTTEWQAPPKLRNPFSLMAQLTAMNWVFFIVGLAAWTADAFDFHALSIQTVKLAKYYKVTKTDISEAITLTLLLRSVGAAMFGFAGDKWGRKWPMVANMIILGLLQIATIYSKTFNQFLAVRSLFGLFMGGVYVPLPLNDLRHSSKANIITGTEMPWQWLLRTVQLMLVVSCLVSCSRDIPWAMCSPPVPT
jgi:hypothetical protein